jgi:dihydrofolate synthase/folylpolyglutamate synthase
MTYLETCEYLYHQMPMFERQGADGYKEGLSNSITLDQHFGRPHSKYRTIHVAGTNGKGSCAHTLSAILQSCGYKVGLYTSPHLVDFSERIRINGRPIEEEYVVNFVEQEKPFFAPLQPSFFEVTTAMAFKYFADKQVDIAVIEVGMGGRLDCTNIIMPIRTPMVLKSMNPSASAGSSIPIKTSSIAPMSAQAALCSFSDTMTPITATKIASAMICNAVIF